MDEDMINAVLGSVPIAKLTEKFYESGCDELVISFSQGDQEIRFQVTREPFVSEPTVQFGTLTND